MKKILDWPLELLVKQRGMYGKTKKQGCSDHCQEINIKELRKKEKCSK